jgi:poly(A) polymerase/tRNA nucleotidyltransferase (CCA-adding enzyme)
MDIINIQDKNLFFIGGIVRDELLGKKNFDIDLTYQGNAIEFAKTIDNAEIKQINEPFGTVRIKFNNEEIDIASTRSEFYPKKGHLPEVNNIGCPLKDDILRRDFTINALAKSTLTGEIIDYTNGLEDLKNKTLRILHDNSFIDDPTRIVRGLKFAIRFGFDLDPHTKELQDKYLENINYDMSFKRLKKELIETFNLNSTEAFKRFIEQGIYKLIAPQDFELPKTNLEQLINKYNPENIWLIYVGLLPEISNLPLTKIENSIVEDYKKLCQTTLNSNFEIYKAFENINLESILMYATQNYDIVIHYLENLHNIKLEISGKDFQELNIQPSPKYQECFDYVLAQKLENPELDKAQEIQLAKNFFNLI